MRRMRFACCVFVLLAALGALGLAVAAQAQDDAPTAPAGDFAWTQWGPDGLIARVVTTASTCPTLSINGRATEMAVHVAPQAPDFNVLVCQAPIPPGTRRVQLGDKLLPVRTGTPKRIVVVGDTGCRLSTKQSQACKDPVAWPYNLLAAQAAAWKPDLVIHVGDFNYREAPCPDGNAGCAGSPYGENWDTWQTDVLSPATPLLAAAPWVFVRGNHETCDRGGEFWFRLLDPRPLPATCTDYTDPYALPLGDLNLIVFDAAAADDYEIDAAQVVTYTPQFATVNELATGNDWLLIHRPIYAVGRANATTVFTDQPTLQAASGEQFAPGIQAMFSGHLHAFQGLAFQEGAPAQVLVGNSGTYLDPELNVDLAGYKIGKRTVTQGSATSQFGYLAMQADGSAWQSTLVGLDNRVIGDCRLAGGAFTCTALAAPPVAAAEPITATAAATETATAGAAASGATPAATPLATPTTAPTTPAPTTAAATPGALPATGAGDSTGLLLLTLLLATVGLGGLALAERMRRTGL